MALPSWPPSTPTLELANAQYVSLLPLRDWPRASSNRPSTWRTCRRCSSSNCTGLQRGVQWWGQPWHSCKAQMAQRDALLQAAQQHVDTARKHEQDLHGTTT